MAEQKVREVHKRFILARVAGFIDSPSEIAGLLRDDETAEKHGFRPIIVSPQRISQITHRFDPAEVQAERLRFLADFNDTPLAFKKVRVQELAEAYNKLKDDPAAFGKGVLKARLQILRDIKAEIGEDIAKLAEAIGQSGSQHLHFDFGSVSDDRRDQIRRNIAAAWDVAPAERF